MFRNSAEGSFTFNVCMMYCFVCCLLEHSEKMLEMLQNKELRDVIKEIDGHTRPPNQLKIAMQFPVFKEFADQCLAICNQSTMDHDTIT